MLSLPLQHNSARYHPSACSALNSSADATLHLGTTKDAMETPDKCGMGSRMGASKFMSSMMDLGAFLRPPHHDLRARLRINLSRGQSTWCLQIATGGRAPHFCSCGVYAPPTLFIEAQPDPQGEREGEGGSLGVVHGVGLRARDVQQ
jgi:hypothetical protein